MEMLPIIRNYANAAFTYLDPESRADAVQEVVAYATLAIARLAELKKLDLAFPTVLARYGIVQFRDGRRVGNHLRICDVLSSYAQHRKGFIVERLDHFDKETNEWAEAIVEDSRTPVPEQAAFRIDFPDWLKVLSKRNRRIAEALAVGHSTSQVARRFKVSPARISQLRAELQISWQAFQHELATATG
jgi:hypothetical protein